MINNYEEQYAYYKNMAEKALKDYSLNYECFQKRLFDSVNYSLLAEGKRLRPVILLASCNMMCGRTEEAIPFAAALEMIHCSSLIHDDLPAMDDDDLRRGKPTNHKAFDEATAILAGDVLLVRPFEIMAGNAKTQNQIKAMEIIGNAAGAEGMMGGQQIDLDSENKQVEKDVIIRLNQLKTGALFKAAVKAGVAIGGGNEEQLNCAEVYGDCLGIAFQIADDLIDNDPDVYTGKTKGSDISSNKSTYLSVYGTEKCLELIDDCVSKGIDAIKIFGEKSEFLQQLILNIKMKTSKYKK